MAQNLSNIMAGIVAGLAVAGALVLIDKAGDIATSEQKALRKIKTPDNWSKIAKNIKKQFKTLNNEDLELTYGNESQIFDRLADKLGLKRDEVISIINLS
ncbi:MAG: hypothetical protein EA412_14415 [Chitinophagaceae bacterium]|nr:MAG: hypothetical protein EA412_14415 [Chitinophagaceae bacterium]